MTDEHAPTGDGSPGDRPPIKTNLPDPDTGLMGRPTAPGGYLLLGISLMVLSWVIGINSLSDGAFFIAFATGLAGLILTSIGVIALGIRVADREREREQAPIERP